MNRAAEPFTHMPWVFYEECYVSHFLCFSKFQKSCRSKPPNPTQIKSVKNANIAVYNCAFDSTATETKGNVLIENAEELLNFSAVCSLSE